MTLVGCEQKHGAFTTKEGKQVEFNNLYLYCTHPLEVQKDDNGNVIKWGIGFSAETFKIKNTADNLKQVFGRAITEKELNSFLGADVNIYYDSYGTVACVQFIKA